MGFLDSIKDFFQKQAVNGIKKKVSQEVTPKLTEKLKGPAMDGLKKIVANAGGNLTAAVEEAVKDQLKGMATDMVNEQIDNNVKIPDNLMHLKDKIVESAVDAVVDAAYDSVKDSLVG
jgi:hypothetical protein